MNQTNSIEIRKAEQGFVQWIKNTEHCGWTHHPSLKMRLENDKEYKHVTDVHSFMTAMLMDNWMDKKDLWKVIDLYKFYLENEL